MKKFIILFAMAIITLVSCEKEISKPEITMHELGYENTKKVVQGSDLHIDAEILAEGKIMEIILEIHPDIDDREGELWIVDTIYTKGYEGLKNADFHEHLEVPVTGTIGIYHFHLKVNDMEGKQTTFEDEIEVLALENRK